MHFNERILWALDWSITELTFDNIRYLLKKYYNFLISTFATLGKTGVSSITARVLEQRSSSLALLLSFISKQSSFLFQLTWNLTTEISKLWTLRDMWRYDERLDLLSNVPTELTTLGDAIVYATWQIKNSPPNFVDGPSPDCILGLRTLPIKLQRNSHDVYSL